MARKIPKDASIAEWSGNRYVESDPDYSLIKTGFLVSGLFLPVSHDRRVCLQHHKLYADWKYDALFSSSAIVRDLSSPDGKTQDAIVLTAPGNHWHFHVDGLANLSESILARCSRIVVDPGCSDDQIAFLGRYAKTLRPGGIEVEKLPGAVCALRNVYIPTNKAFALKIAAYRRCLGRIEGVHRHPEAKKRLYISRRDAGTRQLLNEQELLSMLQSDFGFHPILNEDYDIMGQISIYREADVVMGPHGAGLTNVLFSEQPSLFVEMFNSVQQPFYPALSQALGVKYLGIPGVSAHPAGDGYRPDNAPFRVDVARVRAALGELLN
jgi:hypothetical protein